jgi:hypothetical protein
MVTVLGALVIATSTSSATGGPAAQLPRVALVPNAIAFSDLRHGIAGTGWLGCFNSAFGCRMQGTISITSDGGRTWTVVLRTRLPVVEVRVRPELRAVLFDGANVASSDGGRHWHAAAPLPHEVPPCPFAASWHVDVTPGNDRWALCSGVPGVGSVDKAVYRLVVGGGPSRWQRVAWTVRGRAHGGIAGYGYPQGIAMADDGFGVIWESRGTLYATRDDGSHWTGLPRVVRPETDFGLSAVALQGGQALVLVARGGTAERRLLATRDAGRTWRVVHRWR